MPEITQKHDFEGKIFLGLVDGSDLYVDLYVLIVS